MIEIADNPKSVFSYKFNVTCDNLVQYTKENDTVLFNLTLENSGNAYNEIFIDIFGLHEGWSFEIVDQVNLSKEEIKNITLKLKIGEFLEYNTINLNIKLNSNDDSQSLELTLKEVIENEYDDVGGNDQNRFSLVIIFLIFVIVILIISLFKI